MTRSLPENQSSDAPTLVLASQSPRRAALLREAGLAVVVARSSFVDDPAPPQGREPLMLAIELASRKARHVMLEEAWPGPVILAADTISILPDGTLLGQPQSRDAAQAMIHGFLNREHRVVTGVALRRLDDEQEEVFADVATVRFGQLDDDAVQAYLDSELWRGKAGGYNLAYVRRQGWPVEVQGDETTVLGLPMRRLMTRLKAWGIHPTSSQEAGDEAHVEDGAGHG